VDAGDGRSDRRLESGARRRAWLLAIAVIVLCGTSGCAATVIRTNSTDAFGLPLYSGVLLDVEVLKEFGGEVFAPSPPLISEAAGAALVCVLTLADFPLSAIVDTLCLPVDLVAGLKRGKRVVLRL
jgi:uncharacterized protein YceK